MRETGGNEVKEMGPELVRHHNRGYGMVKITEVPHEVLRRTVVVEVLLYCILWQVDISSEKISSSEKDSHDKSNR